MSLKEFGVFECIDYEKFEVCLDVVFLDVCSKEVVEFEGV